MIYGADYYPEQWPESTWLADVALMREMQVNLVNVGMFSWALLESAPGRFAFGWLDRALDLLAGAGIAVALGTPTAAPPAWFFELHPEALPVTAEGLTRSAGRESFCPSAPAYREAAVRIARELARRYHDHPAVVMWRINNEYGAHVKRCYCDRSAESFRGWLAGKYGDLDTLNEAWGTAVWGERYHAWSEIRAPRLAASSVNPAQKMDFMRFTDHEYLACFRDEYAAMRTVLPERVPITTNFMAERCYTADYWRWGRQVDLIANGHYLVADDPQAHIDLALSADLSRSLAHGQPWLLMEHSTGAVSWQPRNIAKVPGEMRRNTLAHIARGADGAMFFQWRASRSGSEKFHSAMVPQAGTDSDVWRAARALGRDVAVLAETLGAVARADVAVVWDYESWWALKFEDKPTTGPDFRDRILAFYGALWNLNLTVDFVPPDADLSPYPAVVVPSLYMATLDAADNLYGYAESGGNVFVSFFSGIVDEFVRVHPGPYPGALSNLLGLHTEEFHPLRDDERVGVTGGDEADLWSERVILNGAQPVMQFTSGPDAGHPALTRHAVGSGQAWYLATRLDTAALDAPLRRFLAEAGVPLRAEIPAQVEAVTRAGAEAEYLFLINHDVEAAQTVPLDRPGLDLLTGTLHQDKATIPAGGVAVLRSPVPQRPAEDGTELPL